MAVQTFADIAAKSKNPAFLARLAVAVTEHCRFRLDAPQGSTAANVHAWRQALARQLLYQIGHAQHLERIARIVLLPADWTGFNPDDDADLDSRIAQHFAKLAADAEPAPE